MVFENLPDFVNNVYFGSTITRYLLFFGVVLAASLAAKIAYFFINKYGTIITSKTENQFDDLVIEAIEKPLTFFGFIIGLALGYQFLTPDSDFIIGNFFSAVEALLILNLVWLALRLIDGFIEHIIIPLASKTESKLDDQLLPVLRKIAKVAVVVIGVLVILSNFGVDVLPLIAGLGIGGLAVAFAAQKTVEDVFGGISIFASKPFVVGDIIEAGGLTGTVEQVGIRYTRIRGFDGRINVYPNSQLAGTVVKNWATEATRKVTLNLGLTYGTSVAKLERAMGIVRKIITGHKLAAENYYIGFNEYRDSSLNILVIYYIKSSVYADVLRTQTEINLAIKRAFEKEKIEFAFPTQSIFIEGMPKARK